MREITVFLCWMYMLLSFFEPSNSYDTHISRSSRQFIILWACEASILVYMVIDLILRIHYTFIGAYRTKKYHLFWDKTFIMILICDIAMFTDAVLFYSIYPNPYFRFGRMFRPIKCTLESRHLSRTVYAILRTFPQIIDVAVMLFFISLLYALFGNRFLDSDISGLTVSFVHDH